ncbi:MAG: sulfite exporter TauE/SafE family protein [Cytophagaceae bacterium]|nr:sulfite exporter TauE/SafE family protein [Cytophagaceae bacterium]MDW8456112.1 sulfite exporter TauE/SafE family protein [Cytophagaceae bacterium]
METFGYISTLLIGIVLGLLGGGGTILALPVLVYMFQIETVTATAYSLFIVGISSAIGVISYIKKGLINIKVALFLGIPSALMVIFFRTFIIPFIPEVVFSVGGHTITKNIFLMILFSLLMLMAAYSMIRNIHVVGSKVVSLLKNQPVMLLFLGIIVGAISGLVGAGGGFLIIPVLVVFGGLDVKQAIATSLIIIAFSCLTGFLTDSVFHLMDWKFLLKITALASVGIMAGIALSKRINTVYLKPAFGWFVLTIGLYIITKETILK